MAPADTSLHFDAVVKGPVEELWEDILDDLKVDSLKKEYIGNKSVNFAHANRELFSDSNYLKAGVIQTSRGCNIGCDFCIVPECYGSKVTFKPLEKVIEEISDLKFPCFFFADENLLFTDKTQLEYTRALMTEIIERRIPKISFIASYPAFIKAVAKSDFELMAKARMQQVYLVLGLMNPLKNELSDPALIEAVLTMKELGIEVMASFMLGNDGDNEPVKPFIEKYCRETKTNLAEFILYTPFPGTPVFNEMKQKGRIITEEWQKYNGANVVFKPLHQSSTELEKLYLDMWEWFYRGISKDKIHSHYVRGFGGGILR